MMTGGDEVIPVRLLAPEAARLGVASKSICRLADQGDRKGQETGRKNWIQEADL